MIVREQPPQNRVLDTRICWAFSLASEEVKKIRTRTMEDLCLQVKSAAVTALAPGFNCLKRQNAKLPAVDCSVHSLKASTSTNNFLSHRHF